MKTAILVMLLATVPALADMPMSGHMAEDPLNTMVVLDRFEAAQASGDTALAWGAHAWMGRDFNKLLLRTEGERSNGHVASAELEALWTRPVSRWWNLVAGARQEFQPGDSRSWLAVGVEGLAPYRIHVQATGYVGEQGRTALRLETEYDLLLTNRLILQPRAELNAHGKSDRGRGIGSGVSGLEPGLRLRYEIRREVAPYAGVVWANRFGGSADAARIGGEDPHELRALVGLRVWY